MITTLLLAAALAPTPPAATSAPAPVAPPAVSRPAAPRSAAAAPARFDKSILGEPARLFASLCIEHRLAGRDVASTLSARPDAELSADAARPWLQGASGRAWKLSGRGAAPYVLAVGSNGDCALYAARADVVQIGPDLVRLVAGLFPGVPVHREALPAEGDEPAGFGLLLQPADGAQRTAALSVLTSTSSKLPFQAVLKLTNVRTDNLSPAAAAN